MTSPDLRIAAVKGPKDKEGSGSPRCHQVDILPPAAVAEGTMGAFGEMLGTPTGAQH